MIVRLEGRLLSSRPPFIVVDAAGVGYGVELPVQAFENLPAEGETVVVLTHLVVRDDAHTLYGFLAEADRQLFRQLLKVTGIGPRMAMTILSGASAADFALMIEAGDTQSLTRLPGIGKKTAERLILEMRGKISDLVGQGAGAPAKASADAEARAGLEALGYSASEAMKMVRAVADSDLSAEALIRAALKEKMQS
ncbi:MAG TPA: Holliday junction branch migration protein RuvA [Wenzhouxiangella sp.]|nr:Holliday junction branch migration protein RuvA [Wenzhouxiangella sp.]